MSTASAPAVTEHSTLRSDDISSSHDIMTVSELAALLKCKQSSIYNLTRRRGRTRYDNPIPVLRLPMGLRFRKSSVLAWLASQEKRGGVQ